MASIEYRKRSSRVAVWVDGKRQYFPLGQVTKKVAERFANNIEQLIYERRCNVALSRNVANWLVDLDDIHYELLASLGFAESRNAPAIISNFIDAYISGRTDVTAARRAKLHNVKSRLLEHFGDVEITSITAGDADEYGRWLLTRLAPATAHKECQVVSQFFRHAFRKELIARNPFDGISVGQATNDDRRVFVDRDVFAKVLDACPDGQWRSVAALARYGGLRCASEIALLKWSDILWDEKRFVVTSPKTARYGKGSRTVPIFPELSPFLEEAYDLASEVAVWVVPMLEGDKSKNLGTTFNKIIRRAGVDAWPKPFQNLRSSRQTELEQDYPTYVVCSWLGNSPKIAQNHYLTVTEDHYRSAASERSGFGAEWGMQPPVEGRTSSHKESRIVINARENTSFSDIVDVLENTLVAEEGLEPPTLGL